MKFRILRYASSFFFLVMSYTYFLFEPWGSETLVLWSKETSVTSFPKNWEKGAGKSPVNFWHLLDPFSLIQKTDSTSLRKDRVCKVNSVEEACAKCFAVHMLEFEILQITWKKNQSLVFSFSPTDLPFWCFCYVFSCGLQDFKFQYVNRKAFRFRFFYNAKKVP